ncbi:MAG: hypothetical protein JW909_08845 [Planctomycetes bacterium]|nr:hypothetical protein [Planctomycetota bacterium]
MAALERCMGKMPEAMRKLAFSRLIEDVEIRVSVAGRVRVGRRDVLLTARQMVSGWMYDALEQELDLLSDDVDDEEEASPATQ